MNKKLMTLFCTFLHLVFPTDKKLCSKHDCNFFSFAHIHILYIIYIYRNLVGDSCCHSCLPASYGKTVSSRVGMSKPFIVLKDSRDCIYKEQFLKL